MNYREQIISYLKTYVDAELDADNDVLTQVLDSVSLLQLVVFIDQDLGVPLDMSSLTLDAFASVDTVVALIDAHQSEETRLVG